MGSGLAPKKDERSAIYVVATPIGNLGDITLRALEILKKVDLIAAEDTRTTGVLLKHYDILTNLTSYHKFSECEKVKSLIDFVIGGKSLALLSDAGTPLISDPGNILIKEAIKAGVKVVPVGGISAVITFLSSISREGEDFKFIGFLPKIKKQIEDILANNKFENLVFYESPIRIKETFEIIKNVRQGAIISIGRELTKKFEEIKTGEISDIIKYYEINPLKGEIVCLVHKDKTIGKNEEKVKEKVIKLKSEGFTLKDTVKILDITDDVNKNAVKEIYLNLN